MRDEIWYREELIVLSNLVEQEIGSGKRHDLNQQRALGRLMMKLSKAIKNAPSGATPAGAA